MRCRCSGPHPNTLTVWVWLRAWEPTPVTVIAGDTEAGRLGSTGLGAWRPSLRPAAVLHTAMECSESRASARATSSASGAFCSIWIPSWAFKARSDPQYNEFLLSLKMWLVPFCVFCLFDCLSPLPSETRNLGVKSHSSLPSSHSAPS